MIRSGWSLRARVTVLFGVLLAAIAILITAYFPARMAAQARASAEQRALAITQVMSTALGPAIEFDDADNASAILGWLTTTPDTRFGLVRRSDGSQLASYRASEIQHAQWTTQLATFGDLLVVTLPITGLGGGHGTLNVGFSLAGLTQEHTATLHAVGGGTLVVLVVGVVACMVIATVLVRPIQRLTSIARQITRGELPPELPVVAGSIEVTQMAEALNVMLARLNEVNQQLMVASRHAGMAEVATGVLHDVGNVLTSVNVSAELMNERMAQLPVARLRRLHELLSGGDVLDGERLVATRRFVGAVGDELEGSRETTLRELASLRDHVEHIKRVVSTQNAYARPGGVIEATSVTALVADAVAMGCPNSGRDQIEIVVDAEAGIALIDRHRVLQILVNLIKNARDAALSGTRPKQLSITARRDDSAIRFAVADSGSGVPAESRNRIFSAGYTTKPQGNGYGLHSSALAARQMRATLALLDREEAGATFELVVPIGEVAR